MCSLKPTPFLLPQRLLSPVASVTPLTVHSLEGRSLPHIAFLLHICCCFLQRVGVVQHFCLLVAMIFFFDLRSCPLHTSSCPHHWCLLQHMVTVSVWCSIMILFARNLRVRLEVFERISNINIEVQDEPLSVQRSTALGFL